MLLAVPAWPAEDHDHEHAAGESHDHGASTDTAPVEGELPPGTLAVPDAVRRNLGLTFVAVERRAVQDTVRLPGRFESAPHARAEYRAAARGRVEPLVRQYDRVAPGMPLYRLDSAAWRDTQRELAEAALAGETIGARLDAAREALAFAREAVATVRDRLERLEGLRDEGASDANQVADAHAQLADVTEILAEAIERESRVALEALSVRDAAGHNPRFDMAIRQAATLFACDEAWLLEEVDGRARWRTLGAIEVRARQAGVVDVLEVPSGGLVEDGGLVLRTIDPSAVRFRAFALQADLTAIRDGLSVRIVPPLGTASAAGSAIDATLALGTEADPEERTFDLLATPRAGELPTWARPGVAAFAEVVVDGSADQELAIPLEAVAFDELERVYFVRDRANPDQVRRVVGDFGADDGRWIIVNSGVRRGDEVVLEGVHELKLVGTSKGESGGHFHSDGTFHGEGH